MSNSLTRADYRIREDVSDSTNIDTHVVHDFTDRTLLLGIAGKAESLVVDHRGESHANLQRKLESRISCSNLGTSPEYSIEIRMQAYGRDDRHEEENNRV